MSAELPKKGVLGLGKESTLFYLNQIQKRYQSNNKEWSTCRFIMYQIDFQELNPFLPNQFQDLIPKVQNYLEQIEKLGITKLLIPNITLHETVDQINFDGSICHPVTLTLHYLQENNISQAFIFGTSYTMNSEYMKQKFSEKDIKLLTPTNDDQIWIDDFRKEVDQQKPSPDRILEFQNLIKKYSVDHPVVIACTELSLFALKNNLSCIDMAELQIEEFLK